MPRITEKLEFVTGRAVKVCEKAGIGRSPGHKKMFSCKFSIKLSRKRNFVTVYSDFGNIIDVERTELFFLSV
ncbi:MAG: hypothetical protein J7M30_10410 [Deltaproteobacteria bacterium]|nr:hypothetical protein [Deltaproteobacteria bacterium]